MAAYDKAGRGVNEDDQMIEQQACRVVRRGDQAGKGGRWGWPGQQGVHDGCPGEQEGGS